jgi:uncharacterized protein (TIGR03086 family)
MPTTFDAATSGRLFDAGLTYFGDVVDRLQPADWDRPSPDEGWTALDVLGHIGTSMQMGVSILRGERPTRPDGDRPADLVEGAPAEWWQGVAAEARSVLEGADLERVVDSPMGRRSVADGLAFPAVDLYVHGWDIAATAGFPVEIPDEVIAFAHAYIDPLPEELVRGENGAFAPEVDPPVDASPTEAFIAWTGRRPR